MNYTLLISPAAQQQYLELQKNYIHSSNRAACVTIIAAFIIGLSSIVIVCASLCATLPGVHLISQIILPVILPCSICLLASLPLVYLTVKYSRAKTQLATEVDKQIIEMLSTYPFFIGGRPKRACTHFLCTFFQWDYTQTGTHIKPIPSSLSIAYQFNIINRLKKKLEKTDSAHQNLSKAFNAMADEAIKALMKRKIDVDEESE